MWICLDVLVNICNIQKFYLLLNHFIFNHFDCVNFTHFLDIFKQAQLIPLALGWGDLVVIRMYFTPVNIGEYNDYYREVSYGLIYSFFLVYVIIFLCMYYYSVSKSVQNKRNCAKYKNKSKRKLLSKLPTPLSPLRLSSTVVATTSTY